MKPEMLGDEHLQSHQRRCTSQIKPEEIHISNQTREDVLGNGYFTFILNRKEHACLLHTCCTYGFLYL